MPARVVRASLMAMTHGLCHYCRVDRATTLDHIVPLCDAGPGLLWNLIPACGPCNQMKGSERGVCPCDWCIAAEEQFALYVIGKEPKVKRARLPQQRREKVVVAPPAWWAEKLAVPEDSRCKVTLDGQHVRASSGMANYCARCYEILAA